jgi:hypothetical protein
MPMLWHSQFAGHGAYYRPFSFSTFTFLSGSSTLFAGALTEKAKHPVKKGDDMNLEIKNQLLEIAFKRSKPFCYSCYKEVESSRCSFCGSDDNMRLLPGVGCEYGIDWVIDHSVESELEPLNLEEAFEEFVRDAYAQNIQVGWMTLDTVTVMKEMDPVAWRMALSDYISQEESEGLITSFDSGDTYYSQRDLETFVETSFFIDHMTALKA